MEKNSIGELMDKTMARIREMVDVNTVVGEPVPTPDGSTVIPVSRVSFGFASGGGDRNPSSIERPNAETSVVCVMAVAHRR